ncbi:hypothetical protein U0C82_03700 [Fulvimarina sp. 2208YS6-2-32]|uniref:Uncharacterized protein n=1 Tax=Fulvimarina uroteuthidis TaxID=3098149 RepID=A0ABU5HYP8_9HYPH|nr:hypothetical protein [Fulvimarina sp. 2208YS6-2-32]MDY8108253.1 hypothetical protein [Fulvimarina sp. 2208YS6-2-32]
MSKLNSDTPITLDGEDYVLRSSLKAATTINRHFGNMQAAWDGLMKSDLEAYIVITRAGLPKDANISTADTAEAVYRTGMSNMLTPLVRFLRIIQNGGKVPKDMIDEERGDTPAIGHVEDDHDDEGNDPHVS